MFRGALIEDQNFYKIRSQFLSLIILPSILIGLLVNFYHLPVWITVLAILAYGVLGIFTARYSKIMAKMTQKKIEIDLDQFRLIDKEGAVIEVLDLNNTQKIKIKENYSMPQETMADLKEEWEGNGEKAFIIIEQDSNERRFDFTTDSYYMLNQLKKITEQWKQLKYSIENVEY